MKHGSPAGGNSCRSGRRSGEALAGQQALALETDPRKLGEPLGPYGERRLSKRRSAGGASRRRRDGLELHAPPRLGRHLTPSALHYERHHSGIPRSIRDIVW